MKLACPTLEDVLVVREKSPQHSGDGVGIMLRVRQRQAERQRDHVTTVQPVVVVGETEAATPSAEALPAKCPLIRTSNSVIALDRDAWKPACPWLIHPPCVWCLPIGHRQAELHATDDRAVSSP